MAPRRLLWLLLLLLLLAVAAAGCCCCWLLPQLSQAASSEAVVLVFSGGTIEHVCFRVGAKIERVCFRVDSKFGLVIYISRDLTQDVPVAPCCAVLRHWSIFGQSRRTTVRLGRIGPNNFYAIGGMSELALLDFTAVIVTSGPRDPWDQLRAR